MLHWQAPKWLSRISLEARVILLSSLLHIFILVALFVVYQGGAHFNITISGAMMNSDAEIVFMPLHRSIKQQPKALSRNAKQTTSTKSSSTQETAPQGLGTTLVKIAQAKPKVKTKKESKKAADNKNSKGAEPAPAIKKGMPKDAKTQTQTLAKNDTPDVKAEEKKITEAAPQKIADAKDMSNAQPNIAASNGTEAATDSHIVYVGQEEMESLQAQEYIQQELAQHWAPPAGMRSDLQAIVTLTIDFEGNIKQVDITTASGNLLFDAAAKKAAAQITPARWAYGKKFAITFKP